MATIGTVLTAPEAGWKRIDDSDTNFKYSGLALTAVGGAYGGNVQYTGSTNNTSIGFAFTGTKLRIISATGSSYSGNITVVIDGVSYTYTEYGASAQQVLLLEVTGLQNQKHNVTVTAPNGKPFAWDCIDIDDTGSMQTYIIGTALTAPEAGWRRYDDTSASIKYTGTWTRSSDVNAYNGNYNVTSTNGDKITFQFKGTKLRLIVAQNDASPNIGSSNIGVIIDSNPVETFSSNKPLLTQVIAYEKTGLEDGVHSVTITNNEANKVFFDAIDIDSTGRLYHPDEVTDLKDLTIGKRIRASYASATSGAVGSFTRLGQETLDFIVPASSATPNGDFYYICADKDHLGRWKLIADRNIQHSISWDTLNTAGIASGSGVLTQILDADVTASSTYDATSAYYPSNVLDGIETRGWSSANGDVASGWLKIDLKSIKSLSSLKIRGGYGGLGATTAYTSAIDVLISVDDITYTTVATLSATTLSWLSYSFASPTQARYIKLANFRSVDTYARIGEVFIDQSDVKYYTRLLTGGTASTDTDNEWDNYIVRSTLNGTITAGDNAVWNWSVATYSWTSTAYSTNTSRVIRGNTGVATNTYIASGTTNGTYSFRPVLIVEKIVNRKYLFQDGTDVKYLRPYQTLIPAMTANNAPSPYVASANAEYSTSYQAWKAFNGTAVDNTDAWLSNSGTGWLKIDLGTAQTSYQYSITSRNDPTQTVSPKNWTFEGSNDNSVWTVIDTQTNQIDWKTLETRTFSISSPNSFRYYRINITANNGNTSGTCIAKMQLIITNAWLTVGQTPVTKAMFDSNGMSTTNLTQVNSTFLQQLTTSTPKLLFWTDDTAVTSKQLKLTAIPPSKLVTPVGNIPLNGELQTLTLTNTASGNGDIKVVASGDDGQNWKTPTYSTSLSTDVTPTMTSNTAPAPYVASASSEYPSSFQAFYAFNGDKTGVQRWVSNAMPAWLQFDYGSGNTKIIVQYVVSSCNDTESIQYAPQAWTFEGSNDGTNYTILDTQTGQTGWSLQQSRAFVINNILPFRYYRLNISASNASGRVQVGELEMMDTVYTFSGWQTVDTTNLASVKTNGLTVARLNALTQPQLAQISPTGKIRLAYYLDQSASTDVVTVDQLQATEKTFTSTPTLNSMSIVYDQIDQKYVGILFMDTTQAYYSTSLGEILKYLDFGTMIAGQTSLEVKVTLTNTHDFSIQNIRIDTNASDPKVQIEMSKSNQPFVPSNTLTFDQVLGFEQTVDFYVRISTQRGAVGGGTFDIRVKADPVS